MEPGVVQIAETAEQLLARVAALAIHDRGIERRRRRCGWLSLACIPVVLFFLLNDSLRDGTRAGGSATSLGAGIALFAGWRVYRRRDLDNRKIAAVERLVRVLRADIRRDELVHVTADFRSYTALTPRQRKGFNESL